jgi:PIN domain nuclease of toxin-antitoxin system
LLLDTHSWIWFYLGDSRLSATARSLIEDPAHEKLVSPASYWELAIKVSIGKYKMAESYDDFIQHALLDNGFAVLPIEPRHTARVADLSFTSGHRDPFDRLLVAQAKSEGIPIVSRDKDLEDYGITHLW